MSSLSHSEACFYLTARPPRKQTTHPRSTKQHTHEAKWTQNSPPTKEHRLDPTRAKRKPLQRREGQTKERHRAANGNTAKAIRAAPKELQGWEAGGSSSVHLVAPGTVSEAGAKRLRLGRGGGVGFTSFRGHVLWVPSSKVRAGFVVLLEPLG